MAKVEHCYCCNKKMHKDDYPVIGDKKGLLCKMIGRRVSANGHWMNIIVCLKCILKFATSELL